MDGSAADESQDQASNSHQEAWSAAVEEFRALRAEITARIEKQQDITNFAILVIAGLFGVLKVTQGSLTVVDALVQLRGFIPFASLAFSAFTLMALDHEMNIAHLSLYIHQRLRPRLTAALPTELQPNLFAWNSYRASWQQHAGRATMLTATMAGAKYAMTILPNVSLLGFYWLGPDHGGPSPLGWITYSLACAVLIWTLAAAAYTSIAYMRMPHKSTGRR